MSKKRKNDEPVLCIDGYNIRSGGGLSHLIEILKHYIKRPEYFSRLVIFSSLETLEKLPNSKRIKKISTPSSQNFFKMLFWQFLIFPKLLKNEKCHSLFVPGGSSFTPFSPKVVMFQNMLPFEFKEVIRFGFSFTFIKFLILRLVLLITFNFSDGIVFLNNNAKKIISKKVNLKRKNNIIIPHGITKKFYRKPVIQKKIKNYNLKNKFKLLYVSNFDTYKNHKNVIEAIKKLSKDGVPVTIKFVGKLKTPYNSKIYNQIKNLINFSNKQFTNLISINEDMNYQNIEKAYFSSDLFVYASSCENMPIILLEAMASGLPISCSKYPPIKEMIGRSGNYFDPLNEDEIYVSLKKLINDPKLRFKTSVESHRKSLRYSWEDSCSKLLKFIYITKKNNS